MCIIKCKDCTRFNTDGCSSGAGFCGYWNRGCSEEMFCSNAESNKNTEENILKQKSQCKNCTWLELLKEQEARVMAPTEVYTADFVYVEFDGVITPALRTNKEREGHRESYFATQQLGGEWMRWDDYGITWRCWTSRPTDEQKKAVEWN